MQCQVIKVAAVEGKHNVSVSGRLSANEQCETVSLSFISLLTLWHGAGHDLFAKASKTNAFSSDVTNTFVCFYLFSIQFLETPMALE